MSELLEALAVLAEMTGTEWSKPTVKVIEQELRAYPERDVLQAIRRCQGELRGRVTLADLLDRLPSQHPGVEQAWGLICKLLNNEDVSICWTEQMCEAYGAAAPLAGDLVAARMAFKETYVRLVSEARAHRKMPSWSVSLGYDKALRDECVRDAAQKNLISQGCAARLLAHDPPTQEAKELLLSRGMLV
jgi:hypothetical protein